MPDFWVSSPKFIWIKIFGFLFCFFCSSEIFLANFWLSSEWIKSNIFKANLTLFVWSLPIKCKLILLFFSLISVHFSTASCTLFSPYSRWPYSINGKIWSILKVLETAIILGILFLSFKFDSFDLIEFCIDIKFLTVVCIKYY